MDTLGLHIPWPCCALLLESSPMVVASGVTLTSSPRPSRLRSVTRLPGVPTGTRPGPHWEPSPLSRVLSWVRRLPLHLLGAWQGSRGHRIHRLLRFSGGLLATVNLLATITPRCPPRPRESALSLDAVLCLWGRPPSSPLHLRFRGAPPSSPQSRAEQKTVLPPTGTLAQLCALPLPEPQEDSGGLGGVASRPHSHRYTQSPAPPQCPFCLDSGKGQKAKVREWAGPLSSCTGAAWAVLICRCLGGALQGCARRPPFPSPSLPTSLGAPLPCGREQIWASVSSGNCPPALAGSPVSGSPGPPPGLSIRGGAAGPSWRWVDLSGWEEGHPPPLGLQRGPSPSAPCNLQGALAGRGPAVPR